MTSPADTSMAGWTFFTSHWWNWHYPNTHFPKAKGLFSVTTKQGGKCMSREIFMGEVKKMPFFEVFGFLFPWQHRVFVSGWKPCLNIMLWSRNCYKAIPQRSHVYARFYLGISFHSFIRCQSFDPVRRRKTVYLLTI